MLSGPEIDNDPSIEADRKHVKAFAILGFWLLIKKNLTHQAP